MKTFHASIIETLKAARDKFGSNAALADKVGVNRVTLGRWITGERNPTVLEVGKVFDALGIEFEGFRSSEARDVCFVDAKIVPAGEHATPPQAIDYIATPLVGEAGAGPGYLPQDEIKSWFLVYKHQAAVRYRRNLIAVEIGHNSTSMQPTLNPGDIVLVDRDDRNVSKAGHMMLVLDPMDGSGMIKRVAVSDLEDGDFRITYYSDNTVSNPPMVYSLKKDFGNDWEKTIVGRVVWAWSDMKEK